jgi:hypothetical protein
MGEGPAESRETAPGVSSEGVGVNPSPHADPTPSRPLLPPAPGQPQNPVTVGAVTRHRLPAESRRLSPRR